MGVGHIAARAQPTQDTSQTSQSQSGGADQTGQSRVGNQGVLAQSGLTDPGTNACEPDVVHLPSPVSPDGALAYYGSRHGDFTSRYSDCPNFSPPDYYLGYGEKYVNRFTNETNARLSPEGQEWLARARVNLQMAIENQRQADPAAFDMLEKDNDAFRSFAYGTHADAYWSAGLGDLSVFDLASIGLTPDVEDLVAFEGVSQVADIGTRLLGHWGEEAIDYVSGDGTTTEIVDAAYEGMSVVGDGINEVFGEGTSQTLVEHAEELGVEVVDLAHDGYDVAASVVGAGADCIDSQVGEGTVSNTVNSARVVAQGVVEDVESGYNSAAEWAGDVWDDLF